MKKRSINTLMLRKKTVFNFQHISGGAIRTQFCYTDQLCPLPPHEPEPLKPIPNPDVPL
ncbi:hypothetical protein [uncultured Kordia sp.]|uniref:hypothetical protein n=1 Tax=uncultured Kordia sp. TaxID=507699 RepID=UPI002609AEAB|nr:hypothetical protein [uncultured Kordia sp.]